MIHGQVSAHHIVVPVPLRLPNQSEIEVKFVVDTGLTGFLTLPPAVMTALNLPFLRRISASLADGSTNFLSVYSATIVWDGAPRDVEVLATMNRQPRLGTLLLEGYTLTADFEDGGTVTIDPL
jgi:clan AA aspartic protease